MAEKKFKSHPSYWDLMRRGKMLTSNSTVSVFSYNGRTWVAKRINGKWTVMNDYAPTFPIMAAQA